MMHTLKIALLAVLFVRPAFSTYEDSSWTCRLNGKPADVCQEPNPKARLHYTDPKGGNCVDDLPTVTGRLDCKDENGKPVTSVGFKAGWKDGVERDFRMETEITWSHGEKNGPYRNFEKGKLARTGSYAHDKENGARKEYHPNGKVRQAAWVVDDFVKAYMDFNEDGQLMHMHCEKPVAIPEMTRLCGYDGKPSLVKFYDAKGKLDYAATLVSGEENKTETVGAGKSSVTEVRNGETRTRKELHPNGKVKCLAVANGVKIQSKTTFFESGQKESELKWQEGKIVSERKFFQNGQMKAERTRPNGPHGTTVIVREYYDDGKPRTQGEFKESEESRRYAERFHEEWDQGFVEGDLWGSLDPFGKVTEYYPSGRILRQENYKDGKMDGVNRSYFENGKLRGEYIYRLGALSKKTEYNEAGKLVAQEEYYEDGSRKSASKR